MAGHDMSDDPKDRDLKDGNLRLASEFPASSRADWTKLVDGVLKGAPFDAKLVSRTYDNLRVEPIYERARGMAALAGRVPGMPWQIVQRIEHPDPADANEQALVDLDGGATGLSFVFAGSGGARNFGLEPTQHAFRRAVEGVVLDAGIGFDFDIGPQSTDMPLHFAELARIHGLAPAQIEAHFNFDPIGAVARAGQSPLAWRELGPLFARLVNETAAQGFKGTCAVADGRVVHDAGGSEAQELAFVLATATAYLRALEASGSTLDAARKTIGIKLAADANQFMTMAKFRALRKLWARVETACGLTPSPPHIAAETAWRMMTRRDPYVNMLRATIAVTSAGLGGANAIVVLPHTLALGLPDPAARRMARNIQLVLLEESSLARVADPAAGSGGIEDLTAQLCNTAWALFQDIEKHGGIWTALESNMLWQKIVAVRAARDANIARRKDALTGISEFPNVHEAQVHVLHAKPVALPAEPPAPVSFDALEPIRLAEPFEALRDVSDATLVSTGARPRVFLANLGRAADFTERATFAKNVFEAGGIEAVDYDPSLSSPLPMGEVKAERVTDFVVLAAAFKASGAKLVCLCSTDDIYAAEAEAAAKALAAAGATHIYLAGRPGDHEEAFKAAGIGTFVHAGIDVLAMLRTAHATLRATSAKS